ncbi:MAG: hypothetical protein GHCLOJNM_01552 [bacterium]|nr:hypothetical protein [bacterium]
MRRPEERTAVVFRVWRSRPRTVLALFPLEPADALGRWCLSYERVGQHGAADYLACLDGTRPATLEESADLREELERIGYQLDVVQRRPVDAPRVRR